MRINCWLLFRRKQPHFESLRPPVLTPEEKGEEEADVGYVVAVVAADQLDGGDWQVADEVAEADGANHLGHALVASRKLHPHVLTANKKKKTPCSLVCLQNEILPDYKVTATTGKNYL